MKNLDIVTSALNEEGNISEMYGQLLNVLSQEDRYTWSLIVCDDASTDGAWLEIQELAKKNGNVLGIKMARNSGFEGANKAALDQSTADATVTMTSDLQDSPYEIPKFPRKSDEGYDHVYQIVTSRPGSSSLRKMNSKIFYWVAGRLSKVQIKNNVREFRLITRRLRLGLNELNERNRFLRGLVSWVGFNSIGESIFRQERSARKLKANSIHVVNLGTKAILANSYGVLASILIFGFGIIMLALGDIAQYLSLMYEEIKQRPNYLIMETTAEANS